MTRITVVSGDHGLSQISLYLLPDFTADNVELATRTNSVLLFQSNNGFFVRMLGEFTGDDISLWTLTGLEVGRDNQTQIRATDFEIGFNEYTQITDPADLIDATLSGSDVFVSQNDADNNWDSGAGDDTLNLGRGDDLIFAGEGIDRLIIDDNFANAEFLDTPDRVAVRSNDGTDTLFGVELLQFNDRLVTIARDFSLSGGARLSGDQFSATRDDVLLAGEGNDTLLGGIGADLLIGEGGDDTILGGNGRDFIRAGTDNDMVRGGNGADRILGNEGNDVLRGGYGRDTLNGGEGNDQIYGGKGYDLLYGSRGHDRLFGEARNDTLRGQLGDDSLFGGSGNDMLFGGQGNDLLRGGAGNDFFNGGAGDDVFVFTSGNGDDRIVNFAAGEDTIRIQDGADSLEDLSFETLGDDVLVSFSDVTILVQDVELNALQDADNFLF
ncbi:hypothetical protein GG681_03155 [Epibacterium sp. SM1969]|uniref:Bifunctional hemolysin/adenylate cyclase n=1 Tax=Tritonibacter aquimaris TaxID=2663379 RepID=A0A844AK71_9RHOB|nr:calcium-binding protein [Tritonibacter aquimaris]MQY41625.1 hypothetical protein [Tritonibacter aquimaris]